MAACRAMDAQTRTTTANAGFLGIQCHFGDCMRIFRPRNRFHRFCSARCNQAYHTERVVRLNLCLWCHRKANSKNKYACREHLPIIRDSSSLRNSRRYRQRIVLRLCPHCAEPARLGFVRCSACQKAMIAREQKRRERQREALLQSKRRENKILVTEASQLLAARRSTIHRWIHRGLIRILERPNADYFWISFSDVLELKALREQGGRILGAHVERVSGMMDAPIEARDTLRRLVG